MLLRCVAFCSRPWADVPPLSPQLSTSLLKVRPCHAAKYFVLCPAGPTGPSPSLTTARQARLLRSSFSSLTSRRSLAPGLAARARHTSTKQAPAPTTQPPVHGLLKGVRARAHAMASLESWLLSSSRVRPGTLRPSLCFPFHPLLLRLPGGSASATSLPQATTTPPRCRCACSFRSASALLSPDLSITAISTVSLQNSPPPRTSSLGPFPST